MDLRSNHLIWENLYSIEEADLVLLGIPFDSTCTGIPGTRFGPNKIREQFEQVYPYDKKLGDLSYIKLHDAGNIEAVHGDVMETHRRVFETVCEIVEQNKKAKFLFLGGEHSITFPIVTALSKSKKFRYLCLDAHWDLLDDYDGLELSHTCTNRRIIDMLGQKKVQIWGVKTGLKEEYDIGKKLKKVKDPIYLSVDTDLFTDKTSCPVAEKEDFNDVWRLIKKRKMIAADVVEYNPLLGESAEVAELVKRLILKLGV